MNIIIKAPWVKELENLNGVTLKGTNNSFGDLEWIVDTTKCVVSEYEKTQEIKCENENVCENDCHRCANNQNIHILRLEISSIVGKSKLVFESYSGDKIGDCYSNFYFQGIESC